MRRSSQEIAQDLEARAAKLKADADRRLSVAADNSCSLFWDAEKALRALGAYMGVEGTGYVAAADDLKAAREARWLKLKALRP